MIEIKFVTDSIKLTKCSESRVGGVKRQKRSSGRSWTGTQTWTGLHGVTKTQSWNCRSWSQRRHGGGWSQGWFRDVSSSIVLVPHGKLSKNMTFSDERKHVFDAALLQFSDEVNYSAGEELYYVSYCTILIFPSFLHH